MTDDFQIQEGDSRSIFELSYRRWARRLFALAYSFCRDGAAAEEMVQEAFLSFLKKLRAGEEVREPLAYLVAAVRFQSRRLLSRKRPLAGLPEGLRAPEPADIEADELWRLVERLPQEQKEVVYLRISAGLTFEAIHATLGVPQGTVQKRYYTALQSLRAWMPS